MSIIPNKLSKVLKALDEDKTDKDCPILKGTKGALICIVGKKRTGKTSLYLNMLSHKDIYNNYFHNIFMISPSATSDHKLKTLVDEIQSEDNFYSALTEGNIHDILKKIEVEQEMIKSKRIKLKKGQKIFNLLILDDVITDIPRTMKRNLISQLFYNQRHYNLTIILISQSYRNIPPNIRKQIDILHFFPATNLKEKEALQDDWDVPDNIIELATTGEDHPFLTINLVGQKPIFFKKFDRINI